MLDLYLSIGVMSLAAGTVCWLAARWSRQFSRKRRTAAILSVMVACGVYFLWLRDDPVLAQLLPFSSLVILGEWIPLFLMTIAGLTVYATRQSLSRRLWPTFACGVVSIYVIVHPVSGDSPAGQEQWTGDVCLQSSSSTCSAASAATLLRFYGIESTEAELAQLCLTRRGTTWQGLYRGLKCKTRDEGYDVVVASATVDELRSITALPAIISVGIPRGVAVDPIYSTRYGWPPGLLHSVVLMGFDAEGRPDIADPSVGREFWSAEDLAVLYRGVATSLATSNGEQTNAED